ncbi:MAG: phytoene/squalene synthase family protein [Rhodospirillales bacterium]
MADGADALSSCGRLVRTYDPDRFSTSLFAPPDRREDLWAVHAFAHEVAKTREVVSQPVMGTIRLQWWREALDGIYAGSPRRHEVIDGLALAVDRRGLPRAPFDALIDGRERDLEDVPPATLHDLVSYAEATGGPPAELAALVLGAPGAVAAARAAGAAHALAGLMRAVPFHARARRLYLPADLLAANGVFTNQLFDLKAPAGLATVVRAVGDAAAARLSDARAARAAVPRDARAAVLVGTLAGLHLSTLARAGWNPFEPRVGMRHPAIPLRLAWAAATGRW